MPDSIVKQTLREIEPLDADELIGPAARRVIDAGLPALPAVEADGRFAGIFGEREFMAALFPGYVGELASAAMVSRSVDETIERRSQLQRGTDPPLPDHRPRPGRGRLLRHPARRALPPPPRADRPDRHRRPGPRGRHPPRLLLRPGRALRLAEDLATDGRCVRRPPADWRLGVRAGRARPAARRSGRRWSRRPCAGCRRRPRGRARARCRGRGGCGRRRRRRGRRPRSPSGRCRRPGRRARSRRAPRRAARGRARASSGSRVSTLTASEWPVTTGTRTQVALTRIASSPRILRVSLTSLRSSSVWSSPSAKLPACGSALKAIWCG